MKFFILTMALTLSTSAFADQSAAWTCTGKNKYHDVELKETVPYLGDANHDKSQHLYTLSIDGEAKAFFLDNQLQPDANNQAVYLSAKNDLGGSFDLVTAHYKDESDGTTIKQTTSGTLKYSHGPYKGSVKVNCVLE